MKYNQCLATGKLPLISLAAALTLSASGTALGAYYGDHGGGGKDKTHSDNSRGDKQKGPSHYSKSDKDKGGKHDSKHGGHGNKHHGKHDKDKDGKGHGHHDKPKEVGPDIVISSTDCNAGVLGTSIPVWEIGEPVSGVTLEPPVWVPAAGAVPAHCRVNGAMSAVDPDAPDIEFSVVLPSTWTRRYVQRGGGGQNGSIPNLTGGGYLARGWVNAGSDSGHQSSDDSWTLHDEALKNFGYMQMKKTRDAAQVLMRRMYEAEPVYSYWVGNSQGGREGLTVAQRYHNDYDGVLVTVPVVGLSGIQFSRMAQRIQEIPLENWVTPQKVTAIATEVIRQCDGMDGLVDGIVNNYIACRANFDVTEGAVSNPWDFKRCPDGIDPNPADESANACLTDGQIETLQFTHQRYTYATPLAYGTKDFGMYNPNTSPASDGAIVGERFRSQEGAAPDAPIWEWGAYNVMAGGLFGDLSADTLEYVEGGPLNERRRLLSEWLDSTNPNLNPFRAKGGKLISIVGAYDTRASSGEQLDYYQSVIDRMGERKLRDFARLYVIPNAGHGLSGSRYGVDGNGNPTSSAAVPNNGRPDIETLIAWVEQGVAPDDNPVLTSNNGASLPLCEYPAYPRFDGVGDSANAASYSCQEN